MKGMARVGRKAVGRLWLFSAVVFASMWAGGSHALDWSDNSLGYRYGTAFAEPAIPARVSKHIVSFTHVSGYPYGSQFLTADVLWSDGNDPAANSTRGATEFYALYRHNFSFAALSGSRPATGGIRDVALTVGGDWGSKDDAFASRTRKVRLGPTLNLEVPGFLDIGVYWQKEWNHNGIVGREISFAPVPVLGAAWGLKFDAGAMPLEFKGFFDYSGAKGRDGFGNATQDELLLRVALMADIGSWFGHSKTMSLGPGYEYWNNKFGNRPGVGTRASTPMLMMELRL